MRNVPTLLVDLERLKVPHCGLGEFSLRLGEELSRQESDLWRPVYLVPSGHEGRFGSWVGYEVASPRRRFLPRLSPRHDAWHATHQESHYDPGDPRTRYILTIHDLNFLDEKTPAKAGRRLRALQSRVDRASALTFVSGHARDHARRHLALPNVPQEVIHNGAPDVRTRGPRPRWAPAGPFLLALGLVRPRKNFHVLLEMISRLKDLKLVIAGNTDHPYAGEIRERARRAGLVNRVLLAGEVDAQEKAWLLENCQALLFPSTLEGFGLPVVEAMSYGRPVFCSDLASLPEVGGAEAYYWRSFDPDHMLEVFRSGMKDFEEDPAKRERLIHRAQTFSWSQAASKYRDLYLKVLGIS